MPSGRACWRRSCSARSSWPVVSPNFLSEFNFYVLLRSVCVSILVAFAQMVTLAVGQMNLSVGALGGMVAILFGGMMEVFGVPLWLAVPIALGDRRCRRSGQRSPDGAHRHQRLHRHARDGLRLHRRQSRPHQIRAVLQDADCTAGLRQRPDRGASVSADRPAHRLPAARSVSVPPADRPAASGCRRQQPGGGALGHFAWQRHRPRALPLRASGRDRGGARRRPARLGAAADRQRLAAALLRRPDHRRHGAGRRLRLDHRRHPCRARDRAHPEWAGARQGRSLLGAVPARRADRRRPSPSTAGARARYDWGSSADGSLNRPRQQGLSRASGRSTTSRSASGPARSTR